MSRKFYTLLQWGLVLFSAVMAGLWAGDNLLLAVSFIGLAFFNLYLAVFR